LRSAVRHLRDLARRPPTPETRAEVALQLHNKWEGVQSVAAQVLAEWGGREAVDELRRWLEELPQQPYSTPLRGIAFRALARCVDETDAPWVLDAYFGAEGIKAKHEMRPLVWGLPVDAARTRLEAECRSADRENRRAALKAITWMPFPDKVAMLRRLAEDSNPGIRRAANEWLDHLGKQA